MEKKDSEGIATISIGMPPKRSLCNSWPPNNWMSLRIPFFLISIELHIYGFVRFTPSEFGYVIKKGVEWVTFQVYPIFHRSSLGSSQRFRLQ